MAEPTAEGPARRRSSWSLRTIVEDVAGKPIGEFQDPERPVHPYLRAKLSVPPTATASAPGRSPDDDYDPVSRLYPPLVGASARDFHGPEHEHHSETLARHRPEPPGPGERAHLPGPAQRPERLYLHYLLLHMDRLSDHALRYLLHAVLEEVAHRQRIPVAGPLPSPDRPKTTAPSAPDVPASVVVTGP